MPGIGRPNLFPAISALYQCIVDTRASKLAVAVHPVDYSSGNMVYRLHLSLYNEIIV